MSIVMSEAPMSLAELIARLRKMQADYRKFPDPATFEYGVAWLLEDFERRNKQ